MYRLLKNSNVMELNNKEHLKLALYHLDCLSELPREAMIEKGINLSFIQALNWLHWLYDYCISRKR